MKRHCVFSAAVILGVAGIVLIGDPGFAMAQCVPLPTGAVAWYRGEGDAMDSAGTKHGTLVNGTDFVPGKVGQAFSFDGVNDIVSLPNLDLNSLTVEMWINRDRLTVNGGPRLDRLLVSNGDAGWAILPSSTDRIWWSLTAINNVESNASIGVINTWIHIAVTHHNGQSCFYVNGVLDVCRSYNVTFNSNGQGYTLGGRGLGEFYDGLIDEATVYNRPLSAAEIAAIYNAGSAGKCPPSNDADGDGVPDATDNCPNTPNPTQADGDGDADGDVATTVRILPTRRRRMLTMTVSATPAIRVPSPRVLWPGTGERETRGTHCRRSETGSSATVRPSHRVGSGRLCPSTASMISSASAISTGLY